MPSPLTDIQQLRTILGKLDAERPAASGDRDDRMEYVDRDDDFQRRLEVQLLSRQRRARLLVTGQIGVGKSSELRRFVFTQRDGNTFQIHCDLEQEMQPEHCGAAAVLLAICRDCWSVASSYSKGSSTELSAIRDAMLEKIVDMLKAEYSADRHHVIFRFHGMEYPVSVAESERNTGLLLIFGKAALHLAVSDPKERFGLMPDSLLNQLNRLLEWLTRASGRSPIIFVDHVDKIRDANSAKEVLLDAYPQWQRLSASLVMTAPFEYTLGEVRDSIESRWNSPLLLYPLEFPARDHGQIPTVYLRMIAVSGLRHLISENATRLLAHYSGGIPRYFVQSLRKACLEAHMAGHDVIDESDCMVVVNDRLRNYQDYSVEQLSLLDKIDEFGTGLGDAASLLRSPISLLVEPSSGNEPQIVVHPLARPALERYRRKRMNRGS